MRIARLSRVAAIASLAIVAVACGGGSSGTGGGNKGTISIGVDLPESGAAASSGLPTLNGVKFAVQKAGGSVSGWTLTVENRDDAVGGAYNADKGVQNVTDLINNNAVVSMVGPFNSAVGKAEIPIAAPAHFAMISPSNTNPCLTKNLGAPSCDYNPADLRKGAPNNYFRVVATDDLQGPAMADYAFNTLGIKKIGVMDEKTVFGVGIANTFEAQFKKDGGTTSRQSFDPKTTTDWRSIINGFKAFGATAIYVGGTDDQSACKPRGQMAAAGIGTWPYLGGDGIETSQCIDDSASNNLNVNSTSAGADATQVPNAQAAVTAFKKQFPGANDFGGYSIQAYDAANAEIQAVGRAIKDANGSMPSREQVRAEMAKTKGFKGAIGTYNFDANGDTNLRIVSVYTTKQVTDPSKTTNVCGTKSKDVCYVWAKQVVFGG